MILRYRENIEAVRTQIGWSQDDLAERSGVSLRTISNYVNGATKPGIEEVARIAVALGVSIDELVGLAPLPDLAPAERLSEVADVARAVGLSERELLSLLVSLLAQQQEPPKAPDPGHQEA